MGCSKNHVEPEGGKMKRTAWAVWQGSEKAGQGNLSTESRALAHAPYSYLARFNGEPGTNPEELIAAAHAGCFSLTLAHELGRAGMTPDTIRTTVTLTMEHIEGAWTVTLIYIDVTASIPSANSMTFEKAVNTAKANCPLSRLMNTKIVVAMKLEIPALVT
jgi:lipoyl-dependent peroxiredoxin